MVSVRLESGRLTSFELPADFAESELDVRKLLLKRVVHVFLQIGGFDVFDDCCLKKKREQ